MDVDVSKMMDECPFCIKIPFKDENSHYYYFYFCTKTIERWKHKDKTKTTINMMDESERVRRTHRKGSYHLVASKNKLPTDEYEQEEDYLFQYLLSQQVPHPKKNSANIKAAKQTFLQELALSGGDTSSSATGVRQALENLLSIGSIPHSSATSMSQLLEGMWVSLSKPIFTDCLGVNHAKEHLYSLGRMSFDIFQPSDLLCSFQGGFNPIHELDPHDAEQLKSIPQCFQDEIHNSHAVVRTYDTVTAFSIEPASSLPLNYCESHKCPNQAISQPIDGLLTTNGYVMDNPKQNRLSVWFAGGSIEIDQESQLQQWKDVFESSNLVKAQAQKNSSSKRLKPFWERRDRRKQSLASKLDLGIQLCEDGRMEEDGRLSYVITKPYGGHDVSYVDILYMDETLRIMKAYTGPIYVFARIPYFPDE